jgi:hypothetical protein
MKGNVEVVGGNVPKTGKAFALKWSFTQEIDYKE